MVEHSEAFAHIRIILGILQGLSTATLLNGLARFIHNPRKYRVYLPHLLWALALLFSLLHFWWSEMALMSISHWTFKLYLFAILYALGVYLACAVLFPQDIEDYGGYHAYYMARRGWFFGLSAAMQILVLLDVTLGGPYHSSIKDHQLKLMEVAFFLPLFLLMMHTRNERLHYIVAACSLLAAVVMLLDN